MGKRCQKKFYFWKEFTFMSLILSQLHGSESLRKIEIQIIEDSAETAVSELRALDYEKLPYATEKPKVSWSKLTFSLPKKLAHPAPPWLLPKDDSPKDSHSLIIPDELKENQEEIKNFRKKVAEVAESFLKENKTLVEINGKNYRIDRDCAQFVRAVYYYATEKKTDLFYEAIASGAVDKFDKKVFSGVELLYEFLHKKLNTSPRKARLGDIIVFDNTWDKNQNRKRDDPLTHVGVVTGFTEEGTIVFVHGNASRTIKKGYINFRFPHITEKDGKPYNSYGRVKYPWDKDDKGRLNSALVRVFGGY